MWPSDQDGSLAPDGQLGEATLRENLGKRLGYWWNMIFSENRCTPRIKCGAGFLGITFYFSAPAVIPETILFCSSRNRARIGITNIDENAMTRCQSATSAPMKP